MLRRLRRYYAPSSALAILSWVVFAFGWMPGAIRSAHAGGGLGVLRRAMAEAAEHPVSAYLDQWDAFARLQVFHLCIGLAVGYVVLRLVLATGRDAPESVAQPAAASVAAPIVLGLWFGMLSGFGEGLYIALRTGVLRKLVHHFYEANLVTALLAPVTNALLFGALGALIVVLGGRRSPAGAARVATVLFTGLTVAGWALVPGRVNLIAGVVLGLGAAAQAGLIVASRAGRFERYARTSLGHGVVLLVVLAALHVAVPKLQAARVKGRLLAAPDRPSVLWIVLDTERAKSLQLYGRARSTTPFLSRLAAESIVFDRAIAPSSWTLPSHASLFTGRRAREMTVWDWTALEPSQRTIAEVLRDRGYRTAGFAGNLVFLNPSVGLSQGFTEWSATVAGPGALLASTWLVRSSRLLMRKLRPAPDYFIERPADSINRAVVRWFGRRRTDRPSFVFINYFDAHEPFRARPASLPDAGLPDRMVWYSKGTHVDAYTAEELATLRDAYESEIAHLDGELERLFARLTELGALDRTLVIVTADHGEQFGEHGLLDHSNSLYPALVHVPLLIRLPGGAHGGTRVERPVGIRNLGATILDVAGIEGTGFPGTSLARTWTDDPGEPRPVFASMRGWQTVFAEGYQLIVRPNGNEELYRLEDVEDTVNLASDPAFGPIVERLRALLPDDPR